MKKDHPLVKHNFETLKAIYLLGSSCDSQSEAVCIYSLLLQSDTDQNTEIKG